DRYAGTTHMTFSQRLQEIREGFERPFWVANLSELFERLSYYAAFASLARYLHETLNFPTERAADLTGLFGGLVWFLAIFGGAIGPFVASWVHKNMSVENVFRVAAVSVFLMFFAVLLFFQEPQRSNEKQTASLAETLRNFGKVLVNPKFMLFLLIFSGYWIV